MDKKDKLNNLTNCEKIALPLALFAMQIGKINKKQEQTATTKITNITFTRKELEELYGTD